MCSPKERRDFVSGVPAVIVVAIDDRNGMASRADDVSASRKISGEFLDGDATWACFRQHKLLISVHMQIMSPDFVMAHHRRVPSSEKVQIVIDLIPGLVQNNREGSDHAIRNVFVLGIRVCSNPQGNHLFCLLSGFTFGIFLECEAILRSEKSCGHRQQGRGCPPCHQNNPGFRHTGT